MVIVDPGNYTSPEGKWRVDVRSDDGSLRVSRLGPGRSSTICVGGWTAQAGWFACVEGESRVWAFDRRRHLSLTTRESGTPVSETLISYGPTWFPCEIPDEFRSRLPRDFRQTLATND